jgi:hypothetical protein
VLRRDTFNLGDRAGRYGVVSVWDGTDGAPLVPTPRPLILGTRGCRHDTGRVGNGPRDVRVDRAVLTNHVESGNW